MHIETLKVFCDLIETGSFSAAASQNFITQSAVSQQVRALESRYDRVLVERRRDRVRPTPAGEYLYTAGREIIRRYREMQDRLRSLGDRIVGTVRLATVYSVGLYELATPLKQFLRKYPQVNVRVEYSRSNRIYADIEQGTLDLGIVAFPPRRPRFNQLPFRRDRLVLICPPKHPLSRRRPLPLRSLDGVPFVAFERDIPTRKAIDRILRRTGVRVRLVMEYDNVETIKRVVEIGAGVSLIPEPAVANEVRSRTLAATVTVPAIWRPLGIIHASRRHFSPAAEKFVAHLTSQPTRPAHGRGTTV